MWASGCAEPGPLDVDAQQLGGAWVFAYRDSPDGVMDALGGGPATVEDGCLLVGDAVVIWYDEHLDTVEEIIDRIGAGESVDVQIGGGGQSLDEGSTLDDFPPGVLEHCSAAAIWYSAPEAPTF